jgi:hypothetical protein
VYGCVSWDCGDYRPCFFGNKRSQTYQKTAFEETEPLNTKFDHKDPFSLLFDAHSTQVMPRVAVYTRSREILIVGLILHSPHLSQPLDLSLLEPFKIFQPMTSFNNLRKRSENF